MDVINQARWLLYFRGIISVLFGIVILFNPAFSLEILILFFGIYLLVMGFTATFLALSQRRMRKNWLVTLLEGIIGILAGIIICAWPALSVFILLYIIAAWAVIFGVTQIYNAIRFHKSILRDGFLIIIGILMVLFGLALVVYPSVGAFFLIWFISVYSLVAGLVYIYLGFALKHPEAQV